MSAGVMELREAAALVPDGAHLVTGGMPLWRKPVAMLRELVRQGRTDLRLSSFLASIDAETLVGSGTASHVTYGYVGFEFLGLTPSMGDDAVSRTVLSELEYWNAVRAADIGVGRLPFPAGVVGVGGGTEVSALRADFFLAHAAAADADGNVYARSPGVMEEDDCMLVNTASQTIVTVEEIVDQASASRLTRVISPDRDLVVCVVPGGAAPLGVEGVYPPKFTEVRHMLGRVR